MSPEERVHATVWNCGHLSPNPGVCGTCLHAAIVAAEADARREALEEAAKLADETELVPLQGVLAKSKPDADYAYWVAEGFRILARRIRALASQKGEP